MKLIILFILLSITLSYVILSNNTEFYLADYAKYKMCACNRPVNNLKYKIP